MTIEGMPSGVVPAGASLEFTRDTLPNALQKEHALGEGHWGVLRVLEGSLVFVDLASGNEQVVEAPDSVVIQPRLPHKVVLGGPVRCRIDFYRESESR